MTDQKQCPECVESKITEELCFLCIDEQRGEILSRLIQSLSQNPHQLKLFREFRQLDNQFNKMRNT